MRKYLAAPAVVGVIWLFFFIVGCVVGWHSESWTYSAVVATLTVSTIGLLALCVVAVVTIMEWGFKER